MKFNISIKTISKCILGFLCAFSALTLIYNIKLNYSLKQEVQLKIDDSFTFWENQNVKEIAAIAKTKESSFNITTGFEDSKDLQDLLVKHIYKSVDYEINTINVNLIDRTNPIVKAKVTIKTYNNLEVLTTVMNELIKSEVKVDMNYEKGKFIQENMENIKNACNKIMKEYEKIVIVTFDKDLSIPFETNKDFYNALSGNMIRFKEEVDIKL